MRSASATAQWMRYAAPDTNVDYIENSSETNDWSIIQLYFVAISPCALWFTWPFWGSFRFCKLIWSWLKLLQCYITFCLRCDGIGMYWMSQVTCSFASFFHLFAVAVFACQVSFSSLRLNRSLNLNSSRHSEIRNKIDDGSWKYPCHQICIYFVGIFIIYQWMTDERMLWKPLAPHILISINSL